MHALYLLLVVCVEQRAGWRVIANQRKDNGRGVFVGALLVHEQHELPLHFAPHAAMEHEARKPHGCALVRKIAYAKVAWDQSLADEVAGGVVAALGREQVQQCFLHHVGAVMFVGVVPPHARQALRHGDVRAAARGQAHRDVVVETMHPLQAAVLGDFE